MYIRSNLLTLSRLAWLCVLVSLACGTPEPSAADATITGEVEARIQDVVSGLSHPVEIVGRPPLRMTLDERLERSGATGVSIAIVRAGRLYWARGFGVLSQESGVAVSPSTLFQVASIVSRDNPHDDDAGTRIARARV